MKNFKQYINESQFNEYLFEGIDVDLRNKVVTFTDKHENYVDTSGNIFKKKINGIDTYMLFKRKYSNDLTSDGNPLVHALKGNFGWKLKNKRKLLKRIEDSLKKLPKYDVIIMTPSSNPLMKEISKFINAELIEGCLFKRTKDEVLAEMDFSVFSEDEIQDLELAFSKMDTYFESKHFPKKILNKLSTAIFKIYPGISKVNTENNNNANKIKDKNVLIIDDTISSGYSLSSCATIIKEQYFPKTITQFSLFSNLK